MRRPACHHVALLTSAAALLKLELSPHAKVLDLISRVRCRGCGARGRAVVSVKWARRNGRSRCLPPVQPQHRMILRGFLAADPPHQQQRRRNSAKASEEAAPGWG